MLLLTTFNNSYDKILFVDIVYRIPSSPYNGKQFDVSTIHSLCEAFGVKHHFSTPYHSQANRLAKSTNKTLMANLKKIKESQRELDEWATGSTLGVENDYKTLNRFASLPLTICRWGSVTYRNHVSNVKDSCSKQRCHWQDGAPWKNRDQREAEGRTWAHWIVPNRNQEVVWP